ncbi:hypothetical protein D6833_01440 [Candidatus Parcubacteria bacterium]|nr:MAG: hypothetical protein D6833_01440 [Candidatus Parcubacteria bacterium]
MTVKVLMTWDVSPEHEQEYFEFVIGEFIPGVQRIGFQPSEAWATLYGEYPQIQVGMLAPNMADAQRMLSSGEWQRLQKQLFTYIRNFSYKVIPARGGFQF